MLWFARRSAFLALLFIVAGFAENPAPEYNALVQAFKSKTAQSQWVHTDTLTLDFEPFHTQGMVKIGPHFFVSAVEIIEPTEIFSSSDNVYDRTITRTAGRGRGWLYKFDENGALLEKLELSNGDAYHPGGIDFDGEYLWVPVAEYRPNSASDIYRVDPKTMEAVIWFHHDDHIGNIIFNSSRDTFHGASWGSRRFYTWGAGQEKSVPNDNVGVSWIANPSNYIDYQDCQYQPDNMMLCSGLKKYNTPKGEVALGGIDLIDISHATPKPLHSLPITEYWRDDMVITNNPMWAEEDNGVLRFYFLPDKNNAAELLVYELVN